MDWIGLGWMGLGRIFGGIRSELPIFFIRKLYLDRLLINRKSYVLIWIKLLERCTFHQENCFDPARDLFAGCFSIDPCEIRERRSEKRGFRV